MGFNSAFKGLRNTGIINSTTRSHLVEPLTSFWGSLTENTIKYTHLCSEPTNGHLSTT